MVVGRELPNSCARWLSFLCSWDREGSCSLLYELNCDSGAKELIRTVFNTIGISSHDSVEHWVVGVG